MKHLTTCKKPRRYSYAITRIGAVVAICLLMGICYVALRQPLGLGQPSTNRPIEEKFQVLDRPVDIPAFALPDAIGDDELQRVLRAAQPPFDPDHMAQRLPISVVVHALRLWGKEAQFSAQVHDLRLAPALDGKLLSSILLDHRQFARWTQISSSGMLVRSDYGIQAINTSSANFGSIETSTHFGKIIQVMSEIGMSSREHVHTLDGYEGTLREIVQDDAARIVSGCELEFVVNGLARYAASNNPWYNRFHQPVSFDLLAHRLLDRRPGQGICDGIHVLYALCTLLRVEDQHHVLEASTRREIENRLADWSAKLASAQRDDGAWEWEWPLVIDPEASIHNSGFRDDLPKCVYTTGHHLEWMALAPAKCRPPSKNLRKAARYLVGAWRQVVSRVHDDWHYYSQASHAARALWLISGRHDLPAFAARRMKPIVQKRKDRP